MYLDAGSDIVTANTFGANRLKFDNLEEIVTAAITNAKMAIGSEEKHVALDIGPLGRMLEPLGDLPFEKAVEIFADTVKIGEKAGADLILIETMTDAYETKPLCLPQKKTALCPFSSPTLTATAESL